MEKNLFCKSIIASLIFIAMLAFFIIYFFTSIKNNHLLKDSLRNNSRFYFKGRIVEIKKINRNNNIVLVHLDSVDIKSLNMDDYSPFFHGYCSSDKNQVIFYCMFFNDTNNKNLPTYIWVDSGNNKIEFDKALSPYGNVMATKVYGKYMDEIIEKSKTNNWIKF